MLTRLELHRSAVLLESTEESRLEIIFDPALLGFFQFLRGDSELDLDPANLSRLELHRSSLLLESMTESRLKIILGPPGFSWVKHQNLIIQKCCHRSNNLVSEAWCRTTGLAWINVTASCLFFVQPTANCTEDCHYR